MKHVASLLMIGFLLAGEGARVRGVERRHHARRGECPCLDFGVTDGRIPRAQDRLVGFARDERHHEEGWHLGRVAGVVAEHFRNRHVRRVRERAQHPCLAKHVAIAHGFESGRRDLEDDATPPRAFQACRVGQARCPAEQRLDLVDRAPGPVGGKCCARASRQLLGIGRANPRFTQSRLLELRTIV